MCEQHVYYSRSQEDHQSEMSIALAEVHRHDLERLLGIQIIRRRQIIL